MDDTHASKIRAANASLLVEGDVDTVPQFFTPGYVAHLTEEDMTGGHQTIRSFLGMIRSAFPDLQVDVDILVVGDDRVAWQRTCRGTHAGSFRGVPPSGRRLVWRDMVTSRFEDGLIAEEWAVSDLAERMLHG